jgi:membrane protease YdiL (CAAX protease family)
MYLNPFYIFDKLTYPLMQLNPDHMALKAFVTSFSVASFGFVLYHFLTPGKAADQQTSNHSGNARQVILQRLSGVFFFGIISLLLIVYFLGQYPYSYGCEKPVTGTYIWTILLSAIIIPVNYFNAKSKSNLEQYPMVKDPEWSSSLLVLSAVSWTAYLLAYEFLFRGFLLFSSIPVIGIWPAIILNAGVYSVVHIPKGKKEALGAIPFGIIISLLAVKTGSFWIAFFVHVVLALSNEWFSLMAHPEIKLKRSLK